MQRTAEQRDAARQVIDADRHARTYADNARYFADRGERAKAAEQQAAASQQAAHAERLATEYNVAHEAAHRATAQAIGAARYLAQA